MICYFQVLLSPPIYLYKMLYPGQLNLSDNSVEITKKNQYKIIKNLINFVIWILQLPEGPWHMEWLIFDIEVALYTPYR